MQLRTLKLFLGASCLLWLALVLTLCASRFDISHSLSHHLDVRSPLPAPTRLFALPVLGGDAARGVGRPLFYAVWAFLIGGPVSSLLLILRAKSAEAVQARWLVATALYLPAALTILAWVALGLWLPFA